uniref:Uncharacterized protein n=1 Tax=Leersia perrieri TaxID=77586 RepID=A0A0D9WZ64_9ORYZ
MTPKKPQEGRQTWGRWRGVRERLDAKAGEPASGLFTRADACAISEAATCLVDLGESRPSASASFNSLRQTLTKRYFGRTGQGKGVGSGG